MTRREWLALAAASPLAGSPDIDHFFDDFFQKWVRANPAMATSLRLFPEKEQDHLDGLLPEISNEAAHARISRAKEGLAGVRKFDRAKLNPEQRLSADLFEYQLKDIVADEPFLLYDFPLNQFTGVQVRLPGFLTDLHPMRTPKNAQNYLSRLAAAG